MTAGVPGAVPIACRPAVAAPIPAFAAPLRAVDLVSVGFSDGIMRVVATKTVVSTDPYLRGHFPGFTIFPGVFLIEALRQAVAAALDQPSPPELAQPAGRRPDIVELRSARFLAALLPGDVFTIDARVGREDDDGRFDVEAQCFRGDGVTAARIKLRFRRGGPDDA